MKKRNFTKDEEKSSKCFGHPYATHFSLLERLNPMEYSSSTGDEVLLLSHLSRLKERGLDVGGHLMEGSQEYGFRIMLPKKTFTKTWYFEGEEFPYYIDKRLKQAELRIFRRK